MLILEKEFGVSYSLYSVYDLCTGWDFHVSSRVHDIIKTIRQKKPDKKIEVWFQDDARIGQQGTVTSVWAQRGSRPTAAKQTEHEWVYIFGAVNPANGKSSAMIVPTINTDYMNHHLRFISKEAGDDAHGVLVLDQAGWHLAKNLVVPSTIALLHRPPHSPELNCVE
jgi:hypothetical protein